MTNELGFLQVHFGGVEPIALDQATRVVEGQLHNDLCWLRSLYQQHLLHSIGLHYLFKLLVLDFMALNGLFVVLQKHVFM